MNKNDMNKIKWEDIEGFIGKVENWNDALKAYNLIKNYKQNGLISERTFQKIIDWIDVQKTSKKYMSQFAYNII